MAHRIVIAIGGNSLIKDKQHQSVEDQYGCIDETATHIAPLVEEGHQIVISHGNGPQVGFVLLRSYMARHDLHEVPLPSAGADTQGAIGYQIQQSLGNLLKKKSIDRGVVTVVTQVVVDKNDPSFDTPSKPIGPFYDEADAKKLQDMAGWQMVEDAGRGYRRVVASPLPIEIVEERAITRLLAANFVVIAVGGGGIPVIVDEECGGLVGVPAVIDKDRASALLATNIQADILIISTAIEQVMLDFGKPTERAIDTMTVTEAKQYMSEGHFKPGSMYPKVEAAVQFLDNGGSEVIITTPALISDAVKGKAGTRIVRG